MLGRNRNSRLSTLLFKGGIKKGHAHCHEIICLCPLLWWLPKEATLFTGDFESFLWQLKESGRNKTQHCPGQQTFCSTCTPDPCHSGTFTLECLHKGIWQVGHRTGCPSGTDQVGEAANILNKNNKRLLYSSVQKHTKDYQNRSLIIVYNNCIENPA